MEANLEELKMQVANLIARVTMAEAQIAEMDDDFPEPASAGIQQDAVDSGTWSGIGYDIYEKTLDLSSQIETESNILGTHILYYTGTATVGSSDRVPTGGTSINLAFRWCWFDSATALPGSPWIPFEVAEEVKDSGGNSYSPKKFRLAVGKTVGDIHISIPIPASKYMVVQQGDGSSSEKGLVGQYPRTH